MLKPFRTWRKITSPGTHEASIKGIEGLLQVIDNLSTNVLPLTQYACSHTTADVVHLETFNPVYLLL